jgi:hypothetical protein
MSTELQIHQEKPSAVSIIQSALSSGVSPEHLRELLAVRREWEEGEARKAFNLAVAEFQRRAPIVEKLDVAHNKQYARMDRIWREIRPLVTELGLSVTWQVAEMREGMYHVEGQLRHRDGHGERLVMDIPLPDKISGQNDAQRAGSASTYARRYALCGALGIVTGDDDDGNAAGTAFVSKEQADELWELFQACQGLDGFKIEAFWKWAGADKTDGIAANRYADVKKFLNGKLGRK